MFEWFRKYREKRLRIERAGLLAEQEFTFIGIYKKKLAIRIARINEILKDDSKTPVLSIVANKKSSTS